MNGEEHRYEKIESYLDGNMSVKESQAFEKHLNADAQLAEEVALHRQLEAALADQDVMELEKILLKLRQPQRRLNNTRLKERTLGRRLMAAAAALLLLVMLGYFLLPQPAPHYTAYFEPYPYYLSTRSAEEGQARQLNEATRLYESGNYENALPFFSALRSANPDDRSLWFYEAYCQLKSGQYERAENNFLHLIKDGDSAYVQPAEWYLVETYLVQDNTEAAKALLGSIVQKEGDFSVLAEELLEDLS